MRQSASGLRAPAPGASPATPPAKTSPAGTATKPPTVGKALSAPVPGPTPPRTGVRDAAFEPVIESELDVAVPRPATPEKAMTPADASVMPQPVPPPVPIQPLAIEPSPTEGGSALEGDEGAQPRTAAGVISDKAGCGPRSNGRRNRCSALRSPGAQRCSAGCRTGICLSANRTGSGWGRGTAPAIDAGTAESSLRTRASAASGTALRGVRDERPVGCRRRTTSAWR
jgi:hypothetical protein